MALATNFAIVSVPSGTLQLQSAHVGQSFQIIHDNRPKPLRSNRPVIVHNHISHPVYFGPRNMRVAGLQ